MDCRNIIDVTRDMTRAWMADNGGRFSPTAQGFRDGERVVVVVASPLEASDQDYFLDRVASELKSAGVSDYSYASLGTMENLRDPSRSHAVLVTYASAGGQELIRVEPLRPDEFFPLNSEPREPQYSEFLGVRQVLSREVKPPVPLSKLAEDLTDSLSETRDEITKLGLPPEEVGVITVLQVYDARSRLIQTVVLGPAEEFPGMMPEVRKCLRNMAQMEYGVKYSLIIQPSPDRVSVVVGDPRGGAMSVLSFPEMGVLAPPHPEHLDPLARLMRPDTSKLC